MSQDTDKLQRIIEGALMAAGRPLRMKDLIALFETQDGGDELPSKEQMLTAIENIQLGCEGRGFELKEIASGYRFQVVQDVAPWVSRLWDEKPQKYSRALLETLSLIAYRQPVTRGDIEDIRGVAVSSHIIKTLTEREWVKVVGYKDVPGRPSLFATTRQFLDYFNLKNLDELPSLAEIRDLDTMNQELALEGADTLTPEVIDSQDDDSSESSGDAETSTADELVDGKDPATDAGLASELESTPVPEQQLETPEIIVASEKPLEDSEDMDESEPDLTA